MWVIFLITSLVIALAGIGIAWIGNKVFISMQRDNKKFDIEDEVYQKIKKEIKEEKEKENQ